MTDTTTTSGQTARKLPSMAVLGPLLALIVLIVIGGLMNPNFLGAANITNVLARSAFIGIIAVGMTFVITAGGLDLSVGSMAAFIAGLMILVMNAALPSMGVGVPIVLLGMVVALVAGILAGMLNGFLIP
uniref:ABC transporter permease n=1 Tax=Pseudophaeobacter leonis TaxID=1144477 RepID=UPI0013966E9B